MACLSASVIGAPIASIVIIFELTKSYDLAFVAITCVASSCVISNVIFGHSSLINSFSIEILKSLEGEQKSCCLRLPLGTS